MLSELTYIEILVCLWFCVFCVFAKVEFCFVEQKVSFAQMDIHYWFFD